MKNKVGLKKRTYFSIFIISGFALFEWMRFGHRVQMHLKEKKNQ